MIIHMDGADASVTPFGANLAEHRVHGLAVRARAGVSGQRPKV